MNDSRTAYSIDMVNQLDRERFVDLLGPIFEGTPEIAAITWSQRPFSSPTALYLAMLGVMRSLNSDQQLELIRAHPDLGTKAKMAADSVQEQASVGLDQLSPEEFARLHSLNQTYRTQFGFPFIIAVKHHTKTSILQAFEQRLKHDQASEQTTALDEIAEIARLRLAGLISGFDADVA